MDAVEDEDDANEIYEEVTQGIVHTDIPANVSSAVAAADAVNENDPNPINRYCTCAAASCKCCRDFSLPIVPLRGPGCATLKYLEDDKMQVTVKYGDLVLATRTISGKMNSNLIPT